MFPPISDPTEPPARSLWSAFRDAADLAIAFLTLESYGLHDLCPAAGPDHPRRHELRARAHTRRPGASTPQPPPVPRPRDAGGCAALDGGTCAFATTRGAVRRQRV